MSDNTYNGWTNRATWLVNLHFGNDTEYLSEIINVCNGDIGMLATQLEEIVREHVDSVLGEKDMFISDMLNLSEIDWWELASRYMDSYWSEEEEVYTNYETKKVVEEILESGDLYNDALTHKENEGDFTADTAKTLFEHHVYLLKDTTDVNWQLVADELNNS